MNAPDSIKKATILVVDDTPDNLALMRNLLKDDYQVRVASSGEKALKIAASDSPPDLILLDITMSCMDGYEVCRQLKRAPNTMNIPVIFITAKAQAEDEQKGLELGAVDYITKPISPPIVMARVKNHLALQEKNIALERARSAAEKANLAKSYFLSTVSHELRTPLTSIHGALALIAGGVVGELPAAAKPLVDIAHKNCERLIMLVNDILDMGKIEAGKMEFNSSPVKLMPLLKQALDENHAYAEQYKVSYELESELIEAMVNVDSNRMMQVFANLLSNAAKYSPAGGKVLVTVERIDGRIRVAVKDNGPGIPDEFKDRIFQKFSQADSSDTRKKGGTGLGLSIAKMIVEQMGGSIGFDSQPNVQTSFYVELLEWTERKLPEVGVESMVKEKEIAMTDKLIRILYVEDEPDIQTVARLALEMLGGFTVEICGSGNEALSRAPDFQPQLILLDVMMPVMDGPTTLKALRELPQFATTPAIFMTAKVQPSEVAHYLGLGAADVIPKPFDPITLSSQVQDIWERCHD